ncbi:MAG: NAD(P)-dependent oxidoreductase [Balneolaceae bacterium]|nr:NAD(P)-dependent oxidoreductase [Balneolaceae bacterium]
MKKSNILVTGAGGFIGGAFIEKLIQSWDEFEGYAGIRRWASAARIGRFKTNFVLCDIMDTDSIEKALDDMSVIIHCAVGPPDVTVEGTRNLLEAAKKKNIDHFIYISSVDVYGENEGELSEELKLTKSGNAYGDSKIDAEAVCNSYIEQGLAVTIVRPAIVYGPFSKLWTVRFAERLQSGAWGFFDQADGYCNLTYIDDLVESVLSLVNKKEAFGNAYNIISDDSITWNQYFDELNNALDLPKLQKINSVKSNFKTKLFQPVRSVAKFALNKFPDLVQTFYTKYEWSKKIMQKTKTDLNLVPTSNELKLYNRKAIYKNENIKKVTSINFTSMKEGVETSVKWLKHHRIV